jgi:hypothetical protein
MKSLSFEPDGSPTFPSSGGPLHNTAVENIFSIRSYPRRRSHFLDEIGENCRSVQTAGRFGAGPGWVVTNSTGRSVCSGGPSHPVDRVRCCVI